MNPATQSRVSSSTYAESPYSPQAERSAKEIYHAIKGRGTDEVGLLAALVGRTKDEISEIEKCFERDHPKEGPLKARLDKELTGNWQKTLDMLYEGFDAAKVGGTIREDISKKVFFNTSYVVSLLSGLTSGQRAEVLKQPGKCKNTTAGPTLTWAGRFVRCMPRPKRCRPRSIHRKSQTHFVFASIKCEITIRRETPTPI